MFQSIVIFPAKKHSRAYKTITIIQIMTEEPPIVYIVCILIKYIKHEKRLFKNACANLES